MSEEFIDDDGNLTDAGRAYVGTFVIRSKSSPHFLKWPVHIFKQYNGCNEPCDMWTGPCSCGATHEEDR